MRRIADLALMNVLGALYGTLFSIGIVYFYWKSGDAKGGVVPALVCVAAMGIVTSWWYSRKIKVERVAMRLADISGEVSALLKLGFVFMASALMASGAAYLVRIIVLRGWARRRPGSIKPRGRWAGCMWAFILQAMGADFFPRLTAVANDDRECNRLVNEQAEVSLLLAGPGVLGTLSFAPLVIQLFYSTKFGPAVELLRWICLGMMLRVVSWPLGYILLAKGARLPFFWSELASSVVQVGLVWVCMLGYGLRGTGIAFFGGYVFYLGLIYAIVRWLSRFRWSVANKRLGLLYLALVAALFVGWYLVPLWMAVGSGALMTLLAGVHSLKRLCHLVSLERLPEPVRRMLVLFRFAPQTEQD